MVLSLTSRLLKFQSQMPIQKDQSVSSSAYDKYLQLPGLGTLINAQETLQSHRLNPLIIHSYTIPPSSSSSSSSCKSIFENLSTHSSSYSSSSCGMDDMLGTESGVYMSQLNAFTLPEMEQKQKGFSNKSKKKKEKTMMVEYPPPIPSLARTGNLPAHMPWIFTRHYNNGRFIIKEEKVKHHEYFEAYRENGRLILELVPLDDTVKCCHEGCEDQNDEGMELENLEYFQGADYESNKSENECYQETEKADRDDDEDHNGYINDGSLPISSTYEVPKFCHGHEFETSIWKIHASA